ncbi:uncharacterized protein J4E88_006959 [Alternaria novae-zelandiae]|uniref:uncharacterized protein n=1 Tax=Alternaria novae-zelandiae TaxID=430562 RepID=UPI0020C2F118|nr:uncharacterized protein J4E88_006959 [Alternaria novae-zelandiae]KAI4677152.1 hypothetical protein J4E88_006959 [Alternaria novae-zelandiae]
MLADGKIDSLDTHLEQFKLNDQARQNDLTNLLREYGQLLDEYKDLKRAYEQKGKKTIAAPPGIPIQTIAAATTARNPYVLVLIDGNNYIFNDEFIRDKEEGGMRAARMLNDAIEKYLQQSVSQARTARIHVKIYADLTNLSKQLARSKLVGLEKRSLSPFSAAFTRAISLFDFVDALDEEGTKFKIREHFKIASEDTACSHILYAACHDPAYLSQLVPFSGVRDKITLVQGAGWNPEFHQFNLNVTQFPTVFRWSELPVAVPTTKGGPATLPKQKALAAVQKPILTSGTPTPRKESWRRDDSFSMSDSAFGDLSPVESNSFFEQERVGWEDRSAYTQTAKNPSKPENNSQLCKYFQKGNCRFGNKCNFLHIPKTHSDANGSGSSQPPRGSSGAPYPSLPLSSQQQSSSQTPLSALLPAAPILGFVPLNTSHQRLDPYLPMPPPSAWKIYNARFAKAKPCNTFHLQQRCTTPSCPFDHSELEPDEGGV